MVEQGKEQCRATLDHGGGVPIVERVAAAIAGFAKLGVTEDDITRKLGKPVDRWTAEDLGELTTVYRSLKNGEIRREDEFPPPEAEMTAAKILTQRQQPAKPDGDGVEDLG